jgi:hypothetical protein
MQNVKEFYITGSDEDPIDTDLGKCYFIKVKEYLTFMSYAHFLNLAKYEVEDEIIRMFGDEIKDFLKFMPMVNMMKYYKDKLPYFTYYRLLFQLCFREDVFAKIQSDADFEKYRVLIRDMNGIRQKKINPNPEIQKWIDKSESAKKGNDGGIGFKEIMTSVSVVKCIDYKIVNDMTVYQLFADFYRIAKLKGYDTSTLFATVSTEKVKIEDWCSSTDEEEEPKGLSKEDFGQLTSSLFGN